ncbi:hypothetical protein ABMC30_07000, partial [Comamonas kerstersii]|uniref:hypothetical protein n=1 Tax=Comamonas kerstersii TaxID=225992 RepID=UPI00345DADBF
LVWVHKKQDARETRASWVPGAREHHTRSSTITLEIELCRGSLSMMAHIVTFCIPMQNAYPPTYNSLTHKN